MREAKCEVWEGPEARIDLNQEEIAALAENIDMAILLWKTEADQRNFLKSLLYSFVKAFNGKVEDG